MKFSSIPFLASVTPVGGGGGGGPLNLVGPVEFAEDYESVFTQTIGAVGVGNSLIVVTRNDKPDITVDDGTPVDTVTMAPGQILHVFKIENVTDARTSVVIRSFSDPEHESPTGTNLLRWVFEVDADAVDAASDLVADDATGSVDVAVAITTMADDAMGLLFVALPIDRTQTGATGWTAVPGTADYNPYAHNTNLGAAGAKSAAMTLGGAADWLAAAIAFVRA